MLTYMPLEPQFNADQSFIENYRLKMYGLRDTGGQSPRWCHHFSEGYFCFLGHILTYIPLHLNLILSKVSSEIIL